MRISVVGAGAVGARAIRQLASSEAVDEVIVSDLDRAVAEAVVRAIDGGDRVRVAGSATPGLEKGDVLLLACGRVGHLELAQRALEEGASVVSASDDVDDVRSLLGLHSEARERGLTVVVGAGFAPGLTCVLAVHSAGTFDRIDEVHVAKVGTGGPACARQHHRALAGSASDWRDGVWARSRGGTGRELCWFPDPVGPADCYRAALPDAWLIVPHFPDVSRVTARLAANRRDRLTARFPMLRPPHPEGAVGAVRVEVRGRRGHAHEVEVLGAMDRPAVAAGAVAALAAEWVGLRRLDKSGASGLAGLVAPVPFLTELAERGVKAAIFAGSGL